MGCTLCKKKETEVWNDKRGRSYNYCRNCGFIYLPEEQQLPPDKEKLRYQLHHNSQDNRGYIEYLNNFIDSAVAPYLEKGNSILDFGSGPDPCLTDLLKSRGFNTCSYDPFFAPGNKWKEKKFDGVISLEVFEHLRTPAMEIEELIKVLDKGGKLIIRTLLHNEDHNFFMKWWYREDITHISFYSEKTINFICSKWQFELLSINSNCEISLNKK